MPRSTGVAPKGGYNFVLADYKGPQTAGASVITSDDPLGGTNWMAENHTSHALEIDNIDEFTAAAGVNIDGLLIKDSLIDKTMLTPTAFAPAITGSGSMTVTGTVTDYCRYVQVGNMVLLDWKFGTMTLGGTTSDQIIFTLPKTPSDNAWTECYLYPHGIDTQRRGIAQITTSSKLIIYRPDFGNYTLGPGYETRGQIWYPQA